MSKVRKAKRREVITFDQAVAELPDAEAKARAESAAYSQAYSECIGALHRLYGVMARERAQSILARRRRDQLRAVIEVGEGRPAPVREHRENPLITPGLLDAVATGEVETQHQPTLPVDINLLLLVGGLARVGWKTNAHVLAAAKYCDLCERSQIGGARAMDYTQVRVDTSGPQQDQISASQDECRRAFNLANKALGDRAKMVEQVVVYGLSMRGLAKAMGLGDSGRARRRAEGQLRQALDVLVDHFGYLPHESRKPQRWTDGSNAIVMREVDGSIIQLRGGGPPLAPVD